MIALRGALAAVMAPMRPNTDPRRAALLLAAAGVPVFPVGAESKRPLTRHGFHDASTDPRQVWSWWAARPNANLAIPTGASSGVVVVDVDVHGQVDGYDALDRAHRAGLVDGWEITVRSPSGGLHIYYPAIREQRSWQAARAGIDFRGDGGYILVPPSARTIDGKRVHYAVDRVGALPLVALDADRLRDFLVPIPTMHRQEPQSDGPIEVGRLAAWVSRRQEGERNHGLFWAACKMAENAVPAGTALDVLTSAGGQAGLTEREVSTTVRSAYRSVHGTRPGTVRPSTGPQPVWPPPAAARSRTLL